MIKFIHKRHIHENHKTNKIVIYYSAPDIILGSLLMILVVFFIHDYLSRYLYSYKGFSRSYMPSINAGYPRGANVIKHTY